MPGPDAAYTPSDMGVQDLYPETLEEHQELLGWAQQAFIAAKAAKHSREERWKKYHRIYRSWMDRTEQDWRSTVFLPYAFSFIETITPRLVAQLPTFMCVPMGPEDVSPAKLMEQLLNHSGEETDLHIELVKGIKSSLKYGTGILKDYYKQDIRKAREQVPIMRTLEIPGEPIPEVDPTTGMPLEDIDGQPMMTQTPSQQVQEPMVDEMGQPMMRWEPYEYQVYSGPASMWVDIFNFWVAPEAKDLEDARYTIQRSYESLDYVREKIEQGIYRLPDGMTIESLVSPTDEDPQEILRGEVGEDSRAADSTRQSVELLEIWTNDNRVMTMGNTRAILRVSENPFFHGEKPYTRIVDYLEEGEFWGIGEIESIEGLQDLINATVNQRIDNVRLTMDKMYGINTKAIEDDRDFVIRPGGLVRVTGDYTPQEAIMPLDLGEVTQTAYEEAGEIERIMERVTGVTGYTAGMDDENSLNKTATGVSLIQEAGNTKFAMKVRMLELVTMKRLARHWGSIIQQFTDEERYIRLLGQSGEFLFPTLTPEGIQGELDYTIQSWSSTQTESVKKDQALTLFQTLAPMIPQALPALAQDVLEAWGKKDLTKYLMGSPDLLLYGQMMADPMLGGQMQQQGIENEQQAAEPVPGEGTPGEEQAGGGY